MIYLLVRGERYKLTAVMSAHETLEGARVAAAAFNHSMVEQDPPADGCAASWINVGLETLEVLPMEVQP